MRRRALLLLAAALVLTAAFAAWRLHRTLYVDRGVGGAPVRVEIPEGASLTAAAHRLTEAGLVAAPWRLKLVHRLQGGRGTVKAGVYEIVPGRSPATILRILEEGRVLTVPVTLPEGWTVDRSCAVLAAALEDEASAYLGLCREPPPAWRRLLDLPEGADLEGYLYPETYRFTPGAAPRRVLQTLLEHFQAAFDDSLRAAAVEQGFRVHEVVTLASIIEAETGVPEERAKVAAVYRNRLREGWRLEADPTVAYAAGVPGEELTYRDLEMDSPYNTYKVKGLPPGPINSPGRASLVAALFPEPGFEAMYFVADGHGGHVFSRTWEEHRRAVRAYREQRRR